MRKFICLVALVLGWSIPASAGTVYLKDGSSIKALKVWREKGAVTVLVNRYSITSFANSEVDLKRTFSVSRRKVRSAVMPVATGAPVAAASTQPIQSPPGTTVKKHVLPRLPEKLPELAIPRGNQEGTIRQQKREMEKRLNE